MAVDIKLKRSHTHSNIPTTSDLSEGEFAVNTYDGKMYMRDGSNTIVTVGNNYATDYESSTKTFYVTVASSTSAHVHNGSGSSNKYKINGVFSPYLKLIPGITYRFDQSDSTNSGHPFRFYLDENKSTSYTTGVTTNGTAGSAGAYTQIVISHSTPAVLHYQCSAHSLMGWAAFVHTDNLTAFDTGDLTEGSNLYFTNTRADARVNAVLPNTDSLTEGSSNLYYTDTRADARVNAGFTARAGNANEIMIVDSTGNDIESTDILSLDTTNNYIGINQTTPQVTLHMTGEGAQTAQIRMEQYNNSSDAPDVRTRRYRGTISSPSAVQSGDYLYRSNHEYWNGSALIVGGTFAFDNTNNAARTQFAVSVTTDGTSADANTPSKVQFKIDGNDSGAITFNNAYKFPTSDGSANQVLQTDGSGTLSFASLPTSGIASVAADTTPQLGGDLDVNGNAIVSTSNGNIAITPNGTGSVIIDGLSHPQSDGNSGQVITTDGSGNLSFASVGSLAGAGISNVSDDTSPQLGGDLDVATHSIVSTTNRDINLTPNGTGKVVIGTNGLEFGDGSVQTAAGADQGFAIAMGIALG
jgi:hypothetical protein